MMKIQCRLCDNWSSFYREQNSQNHNTMLLLALLSHCAKTQVFVTGDFDQQYFEHFTWAVTYYLILDTSQCWRKQLRSPQNVLYCFDSPGPSYRQPGRLLTTKQNAAEHGMMARDLWSSDIKCVFQLMSAFTHSAIARLSNIL